ncbi:MAG: hypothetical protein HY247_04160 [archaeon]|nr:MAG: hypothetical protein HY247_04160 [archaeon]
MSRYSAAVVLLALLLSTSSVYSALVIPAQAKTPESASTLTPGVAQVLQHVDVAKLPPISTLNASKPRTIQLPDGAAAVEALKQEASQIGFVPPGEASKTVVVPSTTGGPAIVSNLSMGGVPGSGTNPCTCSPPDPDVAVGPTHVFQVVNLAGVIYTKSGSVARIPFALSGFFGVPTYSMSDPQVLYDSMSSRWFASVLDILGNRVIFAVSDSSDPTGSWVVYGLATASFSIPDQPFLGVSEDKFVISANDFSCCWTFLGNQYWVFSKAELVSAAATIHFSTSAPDSTKASLQPARQLSNASGVLYMASVGFGTATSVKVVALTGVPPGPVTPHSSSVPIATASPPPDATQEGTGFPLVTNDNRILSAVWNAGALWFSLTDACIPAGDSTTRSCVRLVELATSGVSTPTKVQDFDIGTSGAYLFYPAVSLDSSNDLVLVYGTSSGSMYPSLAIADRLSSDAPNTIRNATLIAPGTQPDLSFRFGDYFGASADPSMTSTFWVTGEYRTDAAYQGWSTEIARVTLQDLVGATSTSASCKSTSLSLESTSNCTAVVGGGSPTGSITWSYSGTGAVTISPSLCVLSSGSCSVNITGDSAGAGTVTASYSGSGVASNTFLAVTVSQCVQSIKATGPDGFESVVVLVCPSVSAGTYFLQASSSAFGTDISSAAYVFPPGGTYAWGSGSASSATGGSSLAAPPGFSYYAFGAGEGNCDFTSTSFTVDTTNPTPPRFSSVGHDLSNSASVSAACGSSIVGGVGVKNNNTPVLSPSIWKKSNDGYHDESTSVVFGFGVPSNGSLVVIVTSYGWFGIFGGRVEFVTPTEIVPTLSLSAQASVAGFPVGVSGFGLAASQPLTITYDGSTSGMPTGCTTDTFGIVSDGCQFIVPHTFSGPHNVTVSDGTNVLSQIFIDATVFVDCFTETMVGVTANCLVVVSGNAPTGTITLGTNEPGKFSRSTCHLSFSACFFKYTPTSGSSPVTISATYGGDSSNGPYVGYTSFAVALRETTTKVSCAPKASTAGSLSPFKCTATVKGYHPTGNVTWTQGGSGTVNYLSSTCALVSGKCAVMMNPATQGTVVVEATYSGDSNNVASIGDKMVKVIAARTMTHISCSSIPFSLGANITCTATVTGGHSPSGTITWSKASGSGLVNFSSLTCALSSGSCSVTVLATFPSMVRIRASYGGDAVNKLSVGNFVWK